MRVEPAYGRISAHSPESIRRSLEGASPVPFWRDSDAMPAANPRLQGEVGTELLVVGGGFCGLWTALIAKEQHPERSVVLIEANEVAWAASGRNGGFCESSLTHGEANGERHFASELAEIERLAAVNFAELRDALERHRIDAEWEETGSLTVATEPHQIAELREAAAGSETAQFLEGNELQKLVKSPVYRAGLFDPAETAYVHPAKLAWGLKAACERLGVQIFERTPAVAIQRDGDGMAVRTPAGVVRAARVALATNGFPSLIKRLRPYTVPVYDYALVTEPLSVGQLTDIGWVKRFGIADSSRQFHYIRKTADNRILFGGYDAIYHRGGKIRPEYDQRPETFALLADHFFTTFPQLEGVRFTHAWGGMIDMSTKFVAFQGTAYDGRVAYSTGYTGLGVGATRFGAQVMLDLLDGAETERTRLRFVTSKPMPIPPEPFAYPAISVVRHAIDRSDARGGRDGLLLRLMDAVGIGFDS